MSILHTSVELIQHLVERKLCFFLQGLCPPPGTCQNTRGSFRCVCPRGYRLDATGTFCVDADECREGESGGDGGAHSDRCGDSGAECRNSLGSYRCTCPPGFRYHVLLGRCEDFNECASAGGQGGVGGPCGNARCQNSIGSYACTCPTGYQYNLELRICVQAALGCSRVLNYF